METSYTVDFEAEQVRGLIRELTQTNEYGRGGDEHPPLPCSLRTFALNTENPRFARTGGLCSSLRPESSGRGWVLWSFGFSGHAASGGRAMPSSSQVVSAKW